MDCEDGEIPEEVNAVIKTKMLALADVFDNEADEREDENPFNFKVVDDEA